MSVNSFREDEEQKEVLKLDTLLRLYRYLFRYGKKILLVLFIMCITIAINLVNPLIIERAVNVHIANRDMKGLMLLCLFGVGLNVVNVAGIKLRMYMLAKISNQVLLDIREAVYEHIQKLSFHFFDTRPTGKILARVIGDVNALKNILSDSVTTLIPDFITLVAVAVIMIVKNPKLAIASFVTVPFLIVAMSIIEKLGHKRWQSYRKKTSNMNAYLHENLSGIRVVQSFAAETESLESFTELVDEQKKAFVGAVRVSDMFSPTIEISWGVGGFLLYFIGIRVLGVGAVGVGTFMAFTSYLSMFWSPIRNLANFYNKIVTNISAAERVFDILDTEPDIRDEEGAAQLPKIEGRVEFDHVSFAYANTQESGEEDGRGVLRDFTADFTEKRIHGILGKSGCGKSTLLKLLMRFYEPDEGVIAYDGTKIGEINTAVLRGGISYVTQETFLFHDTVAENLKVAKEDATEEELERAARAASIHDLIMSLPDGYETKIAELGSSLSGGERQRLGIARAFLHDADILFLDEPTSNIDSLNEGMILRSLKEECADKTILMVSHRKSTMGIADDVLEM